MTFGKMSAGGLTELCPRGVARNLFWGYTFFFFGGGDVRTSFLPHKKFTWADFFFFLGGGGYKNRYPPRRYAPAGNINNVVL